MIYGKIAKYIRTRDNHIIQPITQAGVKVYLDVTRAEQEQSRLNAILQNKRGSKNQYRKAIRYGFKKILNSVYYTQTRIKRKPIYNHTQVNHYTSQDTPTYSQIDTLTIKHATSQENTPIHAYIRIGESLKLSSFSIGFLDRLPQAEYKLVMGIPVLTQESGIDQIDHLITEAVKQQVITLIKPMASFEGLGVTNQKTHTHNEEKQK